MTVRNPRVRIVTFRLSEHDYQRLLEIVTAEDARSVSDIARDAIRAKLGGSLRAGVASPGRIAEMREQLAALSREIEEIHRKLATAGVSGFRTDP